jgi:hypothetical protein
MQYRSYGGDLDWLLDRQADIYPSMEIGVDGCSPKFVGQGNLVCSLTLLILMKGHVGDGACVLGASGSMT